MKKRPTRASLQADITLEDLEALGKREPAKEPTEGLRLADIEEAPAVFQWRQAGTDILAREQLVRDCVDFLNKRGSKQPLDPLLIFRAGPRFFLVDGHHRREAYVSVKWKGPVPVEYFRGTLKEAQAEAIKRNNATKLRLTDADKMESAWRMLKDGQISSARWTWTEIKDLTGVSRKSIHRMSVCLKTHGAKATELPWTRARRLDQEKQSPDDYKRSIDDWTARQIEQIAGHLKKGPSLIKEPAFTAAALEAVSPLLPRALAGEWINEATQAFLGAVREDLPEKAKALEEIVDAWEDKLAYGWADDDDDSDQKGF